MRNWNIVSIHKEDSRNLESPMSKLWEIKTILEPTSWDKILVKVVKKKLLQLLIDKKYTLFQEKIGMPHQLCDGFLWETSFNYLIRYIVSVEDDVENSVGRTIKYIWDIFNFWKSRRYNLDTELPIYQPTSTGTTKTNSTKANTKNAKNLSATPMFWTTPLSKIQSYPIFKSEESESYCCSKTARLNGLRFWVHLPKGNAYNAWIIPTTWIITTIPKEKAWKKPDKSWTAIWEEKFNSVSNSANFADIYASSSTIYGHRAIAIRDSKWNWYLLDPYIKIDGKTRLTPIKLWEYIKKWREILKAHFYHSNGYMS